MPDPFVNDLVRTCLNNADNVLQHLFGYLRGVVCNKAFAGGRPSSLIYGAQLNPKSLGALLAHYENKVMFQGFVWNINSFDQEGVQLGKKLAKAVLSGNTDGALAAYSKLLIK